MRWRDVLAMLAEDPDTNDFYVTANNSGLNRKALAVNAGLARHAGVRDPLQVLAETTDGFVVAERDLLLRGPGQFLGYRQHGLPEMKMASLADDAAILDEARKAGFLYMQNPIDAETLMPILKGRFERFFGIMFAG